MSFLNKLERKFGRYAIENLTKYIIICYMIGYVLRFLAPGILLYLTLSPYAIIHGQVWRIISWILIPPSGFDIFTIIMLMFYYSLGTSLERTWGAFRYNVYIISGILMTAVGAFLLYFVQGQSPYLGAYFSTYYINLSIFLAFAAEYPNMEVLLLFVIPVKIKWMAYLDVAVLAYNFVASRSWSVRVAILASLLNFIIFFFGTRNYRKISPKEVRRKQKFAKAVHPQMAPGGTRHKCAVCGRTEKDGDDLEFRFCSKCKGNREYCQDHLFAHIHVE